MISYFFIDRPIFATVLSVLITLIGGIALLFLPIAQYPRITPPGVVVSITYPGASAQVVADTVAAPIEQSVNGVEGMLYMSSQMGNDGTYTLTVTFDIGTDLKTALVMVQNRVALAMPKLPIQVQNQGITIRKKTPDILMIVNFYSPDDRYDDVYLSNYATVNVKDELLRVAGVSDITYQGERDYSIRVWLDPQKLASRSMTALDVAKAISKQNIDAPVGQIGQPPSGRGQPFQQPLNTLGRLNDPQQYEEIVVKVGQGRSQAMPLTPASSSQSSGSATGGSAASSTDGGSALSSMLAGLTGGSTSSMGAGSGTSSPMSGTTLAALTGGGTSSGGAGTGGGGTSSGGSNAAGGGTSSGGAGTGGGTSTSTSSGPGITSGSLSSPPIVPRLDSGIVSSTAIGRGPAAPSASIVRLRDVARVELGALNYTLSCTFDGRPSVGLGIYQLPGTNALDVSEAVRAKMEELKQRFPDGVAYDIAYDTTPFIRESVHDVVRTMLEAVVLVGLVVLLFLQDWRAMILPMIDVPVSIIGTFAVMAALGFSLNNISLFGLVLAIGIVVDDAIVVLENIERMLATGLDVRTATRRAMDEVTGPIVAVALVLCAVFVPCAFIGGITGQFFRQFAVTIAVSTVISAINAITMTPSRAVLIFKKEEGAHEHRREALPWWFFAAVGGLATIWQGPPLLERLQAALGQEIAWFRFLTAPSSIFSVQSLILAIPGAVAGGLAGWFLIRPVNAALGKFFRAFNNAFDRMIGVYGWSVGRLLRVNAVVLLVYVGLLGLTYWVFQKAPTGFIPQQDQGRLIVNVQLPDSASLERTKAAVAKAEAVARATPGVAHTVCIAGTSFLLQANSPNFASMFIVLDPFDKRQSPGLRDTAIMAKLRRAWTENVKEAQVTVYGASPIPGLGVAGGFKFIVEDQVGLGLPALQENTDKLVRVLRDQRGFNNVATQFRSNMPQLYFDIDRAKVASLGVSLDDVNQTLDIYLGSLYVNSYNDLSRDWQVTLQADGPFRTQANDINLFQVRNNRGQMVPLGTLITVRDDGGPISMTRYNLATAASISGNIQGVSTGDAIQSIDRLAAETLPRSMRTEWTELMYMQIRAGNTALYVFLLSIISVFLALSALYESWTLPLAVILVVPLCLLCSVAGVLYTNRDVNIFVQIGLVVLVGLACKNAILIVEYAKKLHLEGRSCAAATQEASRLRLRPILMTSFAFVFGVVPLMIASGAGAEMRRSLGTAVFSGMLGVTLFGIFLTPVFFHVLQDLGASQLFASETTRSVGSSLAGGILGAATGYLLGLLDVVPLPWGPLVGGCAGVCIVRAALEVRKRMQPQSRWPGGPPAELPYFDGTNGTGGQP
jgi:multidrug efflux pump